MEIMVKRRFFIAAFAALLMVSCATSKKMAKNTDQVCVDSVAEMVAHVEDVAKIVDTTRNQHEQIIITEITFFSPDNTAGTTPPPEIIIDGTGKVTGGGKIKAIKQTTISKVKEEKGESKETAKTEINKDNATIHRQQEQAHVAKNKERKNPVMWSWVIAASIIAVLVLFLRFRTPIFTWLRKILTALRKILN